MLNGEVDCGTRRPWIFRENQDMTLRRILPIAIVFVSTAVEAHAQYKTYQEAMNAAAKEVRVRNFAASQAPLEAALALAPDDKARIRTYQALMNAYRLSPEIGKMLEACEFILDHSESVPEKSLVRRALMSFVQERGKADDLIKHFDARLAKNEKDETALRVLAEVHSSLKRNPAASIPYLERLSKLIEDAGNAPDVALTADLAQQYVAAKRFQQGAELYEKAAPLDPKLAAWHWKEAANAWLKAENKAKALSAATNSAAAEPETRSELLTYYWNDALGDVFRETGETASAVRHYEAALTATKIDGQKKQTQKKLDDIRP